MPDQPVIPPAEQLKMALSSFNIVCHLPPHHYWMKTDRGPCCITCGLDYPCPTAVDLGVTDDA